MSVEPSSLPQSPLIVPAAPIPTVAGPPTSAWAGRAATLAALLMVLGVTLLQAYRARQACVYQADGQLHHSFTYAADEAYGHLSVARRIAELSTQAESMVGAVGVAASASASPGWTLAVAGLVRAASWLSGQGRGELGLVLVPLVLNMAAAAVLILLVGHLISGEVSSGWWMLVCLLATAAMMPIPLLVLTGLEHTLHAVVLLAMVAVAIWLVEWERNSLLLIMMTALLAAAAVALRYESLAAVIAVVLWAAARHRLGRMVMPGLVALAVPVAIGLCLHRTEGSFVPNAVAVGVGDIINGGWRGGWARVNDQAMNNLRTAMVPWALVLIASGLLALRRGQRCSSVRAERERVAWLFVLVVSGLLHLLLGPTGDQFRNGACLVALGAVAVIRVVAGENLVPQGTVASVDHRNRLLATVCLAPVLLCAVPAVIAAVQAPQACGEVYYRDRMMAAFVRMSFDRAAVAVNHAGAIGFETHALVLDLSGFTDFRVAQAKLRSQWNRNYAADLAEETGVRVAMVAEAPGGSPLAVPTSWIEVGGWSGSDAGAVSQWKVHVYAPSAARLSDVRIAFEGFLKEQLEGIECWRVEGAPDRTKL